MSVGQFAASLLFGLLSILLPLVIFISMVAACVYIARWWIDRKS
ncbi:MAG: hypothetical protein ABIS29_13515 [Vicinamibacterales bacterium]